MVGETSLHHPNRDEPALHLTAGPNDQFDHVVRRGQRRQVQIRGNARPAEDLTFGHVDGHRQWLAVAAEQARLAPIERTRDIPFDMDPFSAAILSVRDGP